MKKKPNFLGATHKKSKSYYMCLAPILTQHHYLHGDLEIRIFTCVCLVLFLKGPKGGPKGIESEKDYWGI